MSMLQCWFWCNLNFRMHLPVIINLSKVCNFLFARHLLRPFNKLRSDRFSRHELPGPGRNKSRKYGKWGGSSSQGNPKKFVEGKWIGFVPTQVFLHKKKSLSVYKFDDVTLWDHCYCYCYCCSQSWFTWSSFSLISFLAQFICSESLQTTCCFQNVASIAWHHLLLFFVFGELFSISFDLTSSVLLLNIKMWHIILFQSSIKLV